jgi:hypothetical protein
MRGIAIIGMAATADAVERSRSGSRNAIVAAGMRGIITDAVAGAAATETLGNQSVLSGGGLRPARSALPG